MDIDIFGLLVFLWFIFKGLRQGQNAKQEHEQKQRERIEKPKSRPKPIFEQRPVTEEEEENPTFNPFPDWFPFPIPIEIEEVEPKRKKKSKVKPKPKQVVQEVRQEERKRTEREIKKPPIIDEPVIAVNPITQGEVQWKNEGIGLEIDRKALVNGIIWSEILSTPRAKRRIK